GDVLPLLWSPDGGQVLALGSADTTSPEGGGGGSGGGGGTGGGGGGGGGITTYKTTYVPVASGWFAPPRSGPGNLQLGGTSTGYFRFATNAFNDMQGRTLVSARMKIERVSGSGNVSIQVNKGSLYPSSSSM